MLDVSLTGAGCFNEEKKTLSPARNKTTILGFPTSSLITIPNELQILKYPFKSQKENLTIPVSSYNLH
jgi:hypothetical protein